MFIGDIRQVPTGVLTTVSTGVIRCKKCGAIAFNASYEARATDEYTDAIDGRVRRRFDFVGSNPLCDCSDCIWLSSDDLPYLADGWPVRESVGVPMTEADDD